MNTPFQWTKRFASHLGGTALTAYCRRGAVGGAVVRYEFVSDGGGRYGGGAAAQPSQVLDATRHRALVGRAARGGRSDDRRHRYFEVHRLPPDWPTFLEDFQRHWPTDAQHPYVDLVRDGLAGIGAARTGNPRWRRMTEQRAGSQGRFELPAVPDRDRRERRRAPAPGERPLARSVCRRTPARRDRGLRWHQARLVPARCAAHGSDGVRPSRPASTDE